MTVNRSPIYRKFSDTDYILGDVNGYTMPLRRRDQDITNITGEKLALCDLSALQRVGYKGARLVSRLEEQQNIVLPPINQAARVINNLLIARLSSAEIMIIEDIDRQEDSFTKTIGKIESESAPGDYPGIYYLPRQDSHSCFMVSGQECGDLFAKLCAVDLRVHKFEDLHVAQTSIARASVVIIRRDIKDMPAYYLLIDCSLAEYLWDCLLDAMREYGGIVIAYDAFRRLHE